jgi:Sulfotransferase family
MATPPPLAHHGIRQQAKRLLLKFQGKRVLHFLHIGKTGGSAVKHALRPYTEGQRYLLYLHRHRVRLVDVPRGEGVIFLVRDPISRFVSAFFSRQRQGQPRYSAPWTDHEQRAFEYFATPNDLAMALTASDKDRWERAAHALTHIRHVRSSYWDWFQDEAYFASRRSDVFFIGFQNTLNTDFEMLKRRLELPDEVKLPDDDVAAHRNPAQLNKTLEAAAVENLRTWFKRDYEFVALCEKLAVRWQGDGARRAA